MNVALFSVFSSVSAGKVSGPDQPAAFVNLYPVPILVRDIVFDWEWTVPARGAAQTYGAALADAIRVMVKVGNHPLTNGFVPVNLAGVVGDWRANTPPFIAAADVVHSTYTWTFPRPMWIPPNVPITIQVQHVNDFAIDSASAAVDIDVAMRGTLDESGFTPDFIDLPYVTAYLGPVRSTVSGGTTGLAPTVLSQTAQTDLFNPFDVPLMIDRMRYAISVSSHGLDGATNANFAPTNATSAQDQTSALAQGENYGLDRRYVLAKLTSDTGRALVKDYAPVGAVFSSTNRPLGAGSILAPRSYYVAQLRESMPLFDDRADLPFQMRTCLALCGSRRMPFASLGFAY